MTPHAITRNARRLFLAAIACLCLDLPAQAVELHMQGDLLSLDADSSPLRSTLAEFSRLGVRVRVDPSVDGRVTAHFKQKETCKALDSMLRPFDYALTWNVVETPLGKIPKLAEIQVFKPGNKEATQPLNTPDEKVVNRTREERAQVCIVANEILIGVRKGTTLDQLNTLLARIGGTIVDCIPSAGVYRIRLPAGSNPLDLAQKLSSDPIISQAEPNHAIPYPPPTQVGQAARMELSAPDSSQFRTNAPPVAVLDTGLMTASLPAGLSVTHLDVLHPELALSDTLGHGTQMSLIAAGLVESEGVASANSAFVPVMPVRIFDDNGYASNFDLMRAVDIAVQQGARVINMSWGSETPSAFLENLLSYAASKNTVLVAAAGNTPSGKPQYPAAYASVLGIGAIEQTGKKSEYSNYGSSVDVTAYGSAVLPTGRDSAAGRFAGTSISAALVSNAIGRYFQLHPTATAAQAIETLTKSLSDMGAAGKDDLYGHGALDAPALSRFLEK